MPYSTASSGRINSTRRFFGPRRPARQTTSAKHRLCCASRCRVRTSAHRPAACLDSRLAPVCSWRLFESPCVGKPGEREQNMPLLLIRGRAVFARGPLRPAALIGWPHTSHRTRQTTQTSARVALDEFFACDDHRQGQLTETSHPYEIAPCQSSQPSSGAGGPNSARVSRCSIKRMVTRIAILRRHDFCHTIQ